MKTTQRASRLALLTTGVVTFSVTCGALILEAVAQNSTPQNNVPKRSEAIIRSAGESKALEVVATSSIQWNGIAITSNGERFFSFPRQIKAETISVGTISRQSAELQPFPGGEWNTFSPSKSPNNPENRFVSVNAIFADKSDNLWVVDAGTVEGKMIPGAPKLVKLNPKTRSVERIFRFNPQVLPEGATLNDVRIGARYAYLTESGQGAIIVVDLQSGESRRLLDGHPSTKADSEPSIVVVIEGRKVLNEKGEAVKMNVNNLELSPDERYLYFKPSFAYYWSRVPTTALLDKSLSAESLGQQVERWAEAMPTGGTTMDDEGNIYLMDLERRAIWKQTPDRSLQLLVRDSRLLWPDASEISNGYLYVPAAQNHRIAPFNRGVNDVNFPFSLFRIKLPR